MKNIKYKFLSCEINRGTEEDPDIEQIFYDKEIRCADDVFESNYAIAQNEAYNGEVTVEDIEDPETEPTTEERVTELENTIVYLEDAICEMDEANDERMAAIEDALCEMDMG